MAGLAANKIASLPEGLTEAALFATLSVHLLHINKRHSCSFDFATDVRHDGHSSAFDGGAIHNDRFATESLFFCYRVLKVCDEQVANWCVRVCGCLTGSQF